MADTLDTLRFENLRLLARVKALIAMVEHTLVPKANLDSEAWHRQLNAETKKILQSLLESFEKQNPGYAARLDKREASELDFE